MKMCPKIFRIVLVSLIVILIFSMGTNTGVVLSQDAIRIPDDVPGPPYVLDQAGETYILTKDITTPATAIIVNANNITLDLNGKIITFDTALIGGPNYADSKHGVKVTKLADGFCLTNAVTQEAVIRQAGQEGTGGVRDGCVFINNPSNNVIIGNDAQHPITLIFNGKGSGGVTSETGSWNYFRTNGMLIYGLEIKYITTKSDVIEKWGTNYLEGGVVLAAPKNTNVHHNTFTYLNANGIGGMANAVSIFGGETIQLHDNIYHHKSCRGGMTFPTPSNPNNSTYKNPYAIVIYSQANGVEIYNEQMDSFYDGTNFQLSRGILLARNISNVHVHHNTIRTLAIGNAGNLKVVPYGASAITLRLRTEEVGDIIDNVEIDNNIFEADGVGAEAGFVGWDPNAGETRSVKIHDNVFRQLDTHNLYTSWEWGNVALEIYCTFIDYGLELNNNVFEGKHNGIVFYGQGKVRLQNNKIIKPVDAISGWKALEFQTDGASAQGIYFIDTEKQGWSDWMLETIVLGAHTNPYDYTIQNTLTVLVKDSANSPVSAANVSASSTGAGNETIAGITDASGVAKLILTDFKNTDGGKTNYTPHTITVTKDGYETSTQEVTMDVSKSLTFTLIPTGVVNNPPVANAQSVTLDEDTTKTITLTAIDADGDSLIYTVVTQPTHGTLSGTAPNLIYTPNSNYNGTDSFTFKANDGKSDSNVATVSITVNPINDPPVLTTIGNKTVNEGSLLEFILLATDIDGDTLTYSASNLPQGATFDANTQKFSFRPKYDQAGSYAGVHFEVTDGTITDSEDITITVSQSAYPDPIKIPDDISGPPYVLDQTGKTYILTKDITADDIAIEITVNGIILDGAGHKVTHSKVAGSWLYGIGIKANDVTVKNCILENIDLTVDDSWEFYVAGARANIYNNTLYSRSQFKGIYMPGSTNKVHDNTVYVTGQSPYGGIFSGGGNEIYNNIINVAESGAGIVISDWTYHGASSVYGNVIDSMGGGIILLTGNVQNSRFWNNTIKAKSHRIMFDDWPTPGLGPFNNTFQNDVLIEKTSGTGNDIYSTDNSSNIFINLNFNKNDVGFASGSTAEIIIKWTLSVLIKDQSGNPVADATVAIKDKSDIQVYSALTDSAGEVKADLTEYVEKISGKAYSTPHTITVSKASYVTTTQQITLDANKSLNITLTSTIPAGAIRIPDDVSGPPYVLDQAGKTYILTQNLCSTGTCIEITANNVILDLDGYTITYGSGGATAYGVYSTGVTPEIKNGIIVQHTDATKYGYGIYQPWYPSGTPGNGIKVHNLTITTVTASSHGICILETRKGTEIYNNTITTAALSDSINVGNKAVWLTGTSTVSPTTEMERASIHDNVLEGVQGIFVGENSYVDVEDNKITPKSPPANMKHSKGILLWDTQKSRFRRNTITTISGGGLLVDGDSCDNIFEDITISINDTRANENLDGIYVRFGSARNTFKRVNVVMDSSAAQGKSIRFAALNIAGADETGHRGPTVDNVFEDCIFDQRFNGQKFGEPACAVKFYCGVETIGWQGAHGNIIRNSVIRSNSKLFDLMNPTWLGEEHNLVQSCTIEKGTNAGSYFSFAWGYEGGEARFLDNILGTGVSYNDVTWGTGGGILHIDWSLGLLVQDSNGQAISGADIVIKDKDGHDVFTGQTDSSGQAKVPLRQYDKSNTGDVYYTPHTITVTKDGYETVTQEVTMDATKSLTVSLTAMGVVTPPFGADLSRVKAYPNPYRGDKHSQVIFDNLTADVKIKIYTLGGELVREIKEQEGDKAYWDMKNKQGEKMSSGIYIYYITNPKGEEKKGKVAIIR